MTAKKLVTINAIYRGMLLTELHGCTNYAHGTAMTCQHSDRTPDAEDPSSRWCSTCLITGILDAEGRPNGAEPATDDDAQRAADLAAADATDPERGAEKPAKVNGKPKATPTPAKKK